MARRQIPPDDDDSFPLRPEVWERIKEQMHLAPQHVRIVEELLRGKKCKEIAPSMDLAQPTLRTYLQRIYHRHHVADLQELLIYIMALSQGKPPKPPRHSSE